MKHEVVNSIGVIATLMISLATAWHQFAPQSDTLTLVTEGRIEVPIKLEIKPFGAPDLSTGKSQPTLGPLTWKIRVHNSSDRSVSIVAFDAFLLSEDDAPIKYSAMRERLSKLDVSLPIQPLPENIPPNESRAYIVSLHVPFVADGDNENKCGEAEITWRKLERCFLKKGRDIFDNKVNYVETEGDGFIAIMEEPFKGPKFAVLLETADGSVFVTRLSFLPGSI